MLRDGGDRQAEDRAHVQRELGQILGDQRDEAGVMRTRRYLAEIHGVASNEQLHAEQSAAAEVRGNRGRDAL